VSFAPEDNSLNSCHSEKFKYHLLLHNFKLKGLVTELLCDAIPLLRFV
jgi:hypothetical protein